MSEDTKPIKILSVDDEPDMQELLTQKFRRKIRKKQYEFVFANNGVEALDRLKEHPDIDFILCDINMPMMDGLTLLNKIQAMQNPALKTIMVTAYGDIDNIRVAMNNGAFDFLNKPINFEDLEVTMQKTISTVKQLQESLKEKKQLESINKDLQIAQNIQLSLIPRIFPPYPEHKEFEIYATIEAAKTVGGDFYDFFFIDDDNFAFLIGDVAGKGIAGAIFMALSRTIIRTISLKQLPPEQLLEQANNLIAAESVDSMFVTVFLGVLNIKTGELNYSNGGHTIPYILRNDGSVEKIKSTGDLVLGVMEDIPYHAGKKQLEKGEEVFVYSDGVPEAMNDQEEFYTDQKLESFLSGLHKKTIEEINKAVVNDVHTFANGAEQSDDITTLCIRYLG